MEVGVGVAWHVEVEDHVDLFYVDSSSEDVSADHDPILELLEQVIALNPTQSHKPNTFLLGGGLCGWRWRGSFPF